MVSLTYLPFIRVLFLWITVINNPFTFNFSVTLWRCVDNFTDFSSLTGIVYNSSYTSLSLRVCDDDHHYIFPGWWNLLSNSFIKSVTWGSINRLSLFCIQVRVWTYTYKCNQNKHYRGLTFIQFTGNCPHNLFICHHTCMLPYNELFLFPT